MIVALALAMITPQVRLMPAAKITVASVEVFVLARQTRAGALLHCADLPRDWLASRTDIVIRFRQTSALSPLTLSKIPETAHALVVVDGYEQAGALGPRTAFGCHDDVTFHAGQTTPLDLTLSAAF